MDQEGRKRSSVWLHFTKVNSNTARCNLCKTGFSFKGGSTSNLSKHLKTKHTIAIEPNSNSLKHCKPNKPSGLSPLPVQDDAETTATTSSGADPRPQQHGKKTQQLLNAFVRQPIGIVRQKKIDNLVLGMVIKDFQPFSIVEDEGFKDLLRYVEPNYEMISRYRLTNNLLPQTFEAVHSALKEELKNIEFISLTTDAWTSSAMQSYVAVTGHFITKNWELRSALLDCLYMPESHTAQNLRTRLIETMKEFNLEEKVVSVTTDNAVNVVAAVHLTGWSHIPCCAHTINLVVQEGLKKCEAQAIVKKVKNIVEHFRRSSIASEKLKAMQKQLQPSGTPLKLLMDVATRWNSTYYMIDRFKQLKESINATLGALHNPVECLLADEWLTLEEIISILKPFELLTKEFSTEKYISISKIVVLVDGARVILRKIMRSELSSQFGKDLSTELDAILHRRFDGIYKNQVVQSGTIMDPRFKLKVFSENTRRIVKANILEELKIMCASVPGAERCPEETNASENDEELLWSYYDSTIALKNTSTATSTAIVEFRPYTEEDTIPRKSDPLEYWRLREPMYPNFSKLAKKYLCAVGSSVPSERVFSKTGLIVNERRTRLKPENIKMIVFLNANNI